MAMDSFFHQNLMGCLVDGEWVIDKKNSKPLISPVTKKEWKTLTEATQPTIKRALEAVQRPSLEVLTPYERSAILKKIAKLHITYKDELAHLITMEMGKPIREAKGEVDYSASYFEWYGEEVKRIYGKEIPSQFHHKRLSMRYEPIGPCAIITPWNFPLAMPGRKVAPALAAGCPVIIKPSPETPVTLLALAAMCLEGGVPQNGIHVLVGDEGVIGSYLTESPQIRKLSFTGSCAVGKLLYQMSADTLKKLTLELGGHAPMIICEDACIETAVEETIAAKFRMSGQTCVCPNRIFVHESVHDAFLKLFVEKMKKMCIGNPLDEKTDLSEMIHPISEQKAKNHIQDAIQKGAKALLQANKPFEPEILDGITPEMMIFKEETFGPVAGITSFTDDDAVVKLANQTPYGLAAYVISQSAARGEKIISKLHYGIIGLNDGLPSCAQLPFGGVKESGFGKEGGSLGIYEYLSAKSISQKF